MKSNMETAGYRQYLTFKIGDSPYAIDILRVKEIIRHEKVTSVPCAPESIRGVINLRGNVVPVVDLGVLFHRASRETTSRTCIVIVEVGSGSEALTLGLIVDNVDQVAQFAESDIDPPPSFGTPLAARYLTGMGKADGGLCMILNTEAVFNPEEIAALSASLTETAMAAETENLEEAGAVT